MGVPLRMRQGVAQHKRPSRTLVAYACGDVLPSLLVRAHDTVMHWAKVACAKGTAPDGPTAVGRMGRQPSADNPTSP